MLFSTVPELQYVNNSLALSLSYLSGAFGFQYAVGSMLASLYGCWWLAFELHWLSRWGWGRRTKTTWANCFLTQGATIQKAVASQTKTIQSWWLKLGTWPELVLETQAMYWFYACACMNAGHLQPPLWELSPEFVSKDYFHRVLSNGFFFGSQG